MYSEQHYTDRDNSDLDVESNPERLDLRINGEQFVFTASLDRASKSERDAERLAAELKAWASEAMNRRMEHKKGQKA